MDTCLSLFSTVTAKYLKLGNSYFKKDIHFWQCYGLGNPRAWCTLRWCSLGLELRRAGPCIQEPGRPVRRTQPGTWLLRSEGAFALLLLSQVLSRREYHQLWVCFWPTHLESSPSFLPPPSRAKEEISLDVCFPDAFGRFRFTFGG